MSLRFYTNVQLIGNQFLVRGYENGKRFEIRDEFYPTLFVKTKKESKYKTLEGVPHSQVIKEKEHSVFYIDQYNPLSVGGYGVSTLESLFASNLTFSTINNISDSMFKLTGQYECPVISLGTSQEELYFVLNNFILTSTENQLIEYMEGIGQWLETVYSPQSIVNYFNTI